MTATQLATENRPRSPVDGEQPKLASRRPWLPWLVFGLSLVLFAYGVTTIPSAVPSQFGLLAVASPTFGISILVAAVGFAISVRQGNIRAAIVATLLMIVVVRLPRTVATDLPMYAWTYKHLGVVDYIQHAHGLARDVDIYNGWPGLFALTAWFSELTGVSATSIAHWFTPLFHLGFAAIVYGAARAWRLEPLNAVTAVLLVEALNWVEQDYYSPQATTMLLVAGIVTLVGLSRDRPIAVWVLVLLFTAATVTHQLTPYWLLLMIGLLAVTAKFKPWWLVVPLAAIVGTWLLYNWHQASEFSLFSADVTQNIKPNIPTVGVLGQRITSAGVRALAGAMWLGTAVVLLLRWRRKKEPFWDLWPMAVLGLSPILMVLVQSYGGEVIFRVYLYSLIGCAIVLAPVLVRLLQGELRRYYVGLIGLLGATVVSVQGSTGAWYANVMPKAQVDASKIVLSQAELPAYLTSVAPVWPERSSWRYVDYARFNKYFDGLMIQAAFLAGRHFNTDEDYRQFVAALNSRPDASTYLIMTEQMQVYAWYYGVLPWDALPNLKEYLKRDTDRWQPFYDGQGITVFLHKVDTGKIGK
ncbi:hypothetical protein [Mycolicibacterium moriokaense]|uniref:Glycosyltransferase RgtA/B/C/D-like domain-containing protein n=1 Tax=Mycolicibacterium moriokaense TaxID=39691 RepID=A0A318HKV0_9MYCO|nr:hypothetical protein [Mycolicibacterium moriokaense]PXX03206.1 hypothetical protein C8E89_1238 [Mycolicibacterium moriokaense]